MAAAAKKAQGATLWIGAAGTDPASATWTQIKRVGSIGDIDVKAAVIDATALEDTYKRKLKGVLDYGNIAIGFHRVQGDAGQEAMKTAAADLTEALYPFKVQLDDQPSGGTSPTKYTFSGFVTSFGAALSGPSALLAGKATIEIDGAVTEANAA